MARNFKPSFELVLKDKFKLTTLLLCGAVLQSVLYWGFVLLGFPHWIVWFSSPIVLILLAGKLAASNYGFLSTDKFQNIIRGRYTIQIPDADGSMPSGPSAHGIVVFIFAVRALSKDAFPGSDFRKFADDMTEMWEDAEQNKEQYGYLGRTYPLLSMEEQTNNAFVSISYWRSVEHLHRFAASPAHKKGWTWFNKLNKTNPKLGMMHELYHAPAHHWENIYEDFPLFGMGLTTYSVKGKSSSLTGPHRLSEGPMWKSMKSRLGVQE